MNETGNRLRATTTAASRLYIALRTNDERVAAMRCNPSPQHGFVLGLVH
jgi:hypothetical protein